MQDLGRVPTPVVASRADRHLWRLLGPAFVAAVAYVDPGNVATNLAAGTQYGYLLVWVVLVANFAAVVVQYLSAKLGIVTGQSLPALLGARLPRMRRVLYWLQAEAVAAATEIAEVLGGALALDILCGIPLVVGGVIVVAVSLTILAVQSRHGQQPFELVVIGMLAVLTLGFAAGLLVSPLHWGDVVRGTVPRFDDSHSVLLAAGMVGATVMPHAIYAHSGLARDRHIGRTPAGHGRIVQLLRATRWDVLMALAIAGGVNLAMLLLAAGSLHGVPGTDTIPGATHAISTHLGPTIGVAFGIGLLTSSLASTAVGGYAGSTITADLLHRRVPILVRRTLTVVPALLVLASGIDPTSALVLSQIVLSVGIPFALIPLARLTGQRAVMGAFVNGPALRAAAGLITVAIVVLNVVLVILAFHG